MVCKLSTTAKSQLSQTHLQVEMPEACSCCHVLLTVELHVASVHHSVVHHRHQSGRCPHLMQDACLEHGDVAAAKILYQAPLPHPKVASVLLDIQCHCQSLSQGHVPEGDPGSHGFALSQNRITLHNFVKQSLHDVTVAKGLLHGSHLCLRGAHGIEHCGTFDCCHACALGKPLQAQKQLIQLSPSTACRYLCMPMLRTAAEPQDLELHDEDITHLKSLMAGFADGCRWPQPPLLVQQQQIRCCAALPDQNRSFVDHLQSPLQERSLGQFMQRLVGLSQVFYMTCM